MTVEVSMVHHSPVGNSFQIKVDGRLFTIWPGSYVGFDFDGTLARTDNPGHYKPPYPIGGPVTSMVLLCRHLRAHGVPIVIFTGRVGTEFFNQSEIERWCKQNIGEVLPVTNIKKPEMAMFFDDRAIPVEENNASVIFL